MCLKFSLAVVLTILQQAFLYSVYQKLPELNITEFNMTSHLYYEHVKKICYSKNAICDINATTVCTARKVKGNVEYRDFENSCFAYISNMCDYPGDEFSIIQGGNCAIFLKTRRIGDNSTEVEEANEVNQSNQTDYDMDRTNITEKPALRTTPFSPLYDVESAFDYHSCPFSCPDVYSPVCLNANRGFGKYLKFYIFVNHCAGDLYYCKNWAEFAPPPGEDETVTGSPLSWSYCSSYRYLQFARFSEVTSAMGHYGWLNGDYRYSKILEPSQIKPGYG